MLELHRQIYLPKAGLHAARDLWATKTSLHPHKYEKLPCLQSIRETVTITRQGRNYLSNFLPCAEKGERDNQIYHATVLCVEREITKIPN